MKVRLAYSKVGKIRFLGHLDMAHLWERAFRKAKLGVAVSAGFTPRPKLSFGLALPTAGESLVEVLDVVLDPAPSAERDLDDLAPRLSAVMPAGVEVTGAWVAGPQSIQEDVVATTWVLAIDRAAHDTAARVAALVAAPEFWIERERKGERRRDDIRPGIFELRTDFDPSVLPADWRSEVSASALVEAVVTTSGRGVRPTELVDALFPGDEPWNVMSRVIRTHQWIERTDAPCAPFSVRARKELPHEQRIAVG